MTPFEKVSIIKGISKYLSSSLDWTDLQIYFDAHRIPKVNISGDIHDCCKARLAVASNQTICDIAQELELLPEESKKDINQTSNLWKAGFFRLFLSHISGFKEKTHILKSLLEKYGISCFVAHDDIKPTTLWQNEIEKALKSSDALVALLMDGFHESSWCDQEIGFALGRDIPVIPVKKELDPYGFIGKIQAIQGSEKTITEVATKIFNILVDLPETREKIINSLINAIVTTTAEKDGINRLKILSGINNLPVTLFESLKEGVSNNEVLLNSEEFISELNSVLLSNGLNQFDPKPKESPDWMEEEVPF